MAPCRRGVQDSWPRASRIPGLGRRKLALAVDAPDRHVLDEGDCGHADARKGVEQPRGGDDVWSDLKRRNEIRGAQA
jgi:hypothetical protein